MSDVNHISAQPAAANRHLYGIAIVTLGVAILSPDGLLTSLVGADIWTMLFWRGLLMGTGMLAIALAREPAPLARLKTAITRPAIGIALLYGMTSVCFVMAVVTTSVANTLFIIAATPLFAAGLAWAVLGERPTLRTVIAIFACIGGMAVIFADGLGRGDMLGNLAAVGAGAAWAGILVILRHAPHTDMPVAMASGGGVTALVALPFAATLAVAGPDILWLALLGLIVLPVSHVLIGVGPRHLPASEVSLLMLLEAVLGPLWAWLFIAQLPSAQSVLGGAIILTTLAIHFALGLRAEARRVRL